MPNENQTATTNNRANSIQNVTFETKYTKSIDTSGWLKIKLEPSGEFAFVCEYTKVIIQRKASGRTYFLIKEGRYANQTASLSDANVPRCLVSYTRGTGATLTVVKQGRRRETSIVRNREWNQLFASLNFNGQTARITIDSDIDYEETNRNSPDFGQIKHSRPLPDGTYRILAPFTAGDSRATGYYRTHPNGYSNLQYDTVWFPIEYAPTHNSNFVHVGHLSEGCITCYELQKWNDLYHYLITNRSGQNGEYVGTLIIR